MNLYLFNTTIITGEGFFACQKISTDRAKAILNYSQKVISAIGHDATAQAMSTILGQDIPVQRIQAEMQSGDRAICMKVRGGLPYGKILSADELESIGYDLYEVVKYEPNDQIRLAYDVGTYTGSLHVDQSDVFTIPNLYSHNG